MMNLHGGQYVCQHDQRGTLFAVTAQNSTAQHSTAQHSTAEGTKRRKTIHLPGSLAPALPYNHEVQQLSNKHKEVFPFLGNKPQPADKMHQVTCYSAPRKLLPAASTQNEFSKPQRKIATVQYQLQLSLQQADTATASCAQNLTEDQL
jgi:hypothetical protein